MRKVLLVFLVLLSLVSTCLAYSVPPDTIVYVTNSGEKYHRENCSYLKSSRSMTIAQAETSGYTPCSRCSPDVLLGEYESDWDGEPGGSSVHSKPKPTVNPTPSTEPATTDQVEKDAVAYVVLVFFALLFGIPLVLSIVGTIASFVVALLESKRKKKQK